MSIAAVFATINIFLPLIKNSKTLAAENTWLFETPANYTYDSAKVESSSGKLQLKANDATENFNLSGGKLHNDTILAVAADDVNYYANTSSGIDIINQTSHDQVGYITYAGGFTSISVAGGYLYAGKTAVGVWRWQISTISGSTSMPDIRYSTATSPAISNNNIVKIDAKYINGTMYIALALSNIVHLIKNDLGTPQVLSITTAGWACTSIALSDGGDLYYNMSSGRTNGSVLAKYNAIDIYPGWVYGSNDADYGNNYTAQHGPDPTWQGIIDISVSSGTSSARAGDNTIYLSTNDGVVIIQENQATASLGTMEQISTDSNGSNLITGATAQGRMATTAANTVDANMGTYYYPNQSSKHDWLEYDLGSQKTFNKVKQFFYNSLTYSPKDFSIQTSTQGTTANLGTAATIRTTPWQLGASYGPTKVNDSDLNSYFYSAFSTSRGPTIIEANYATDQTIGGVDMQYFNTPGNAAADYLVQTSTTTTSADIGSGKTATASSTSTTNTASRTLDDDLATSWISNEATDTAAQWLKVDLGSAQNVAGAYWINTSGYTTNNFQVQYSTNDVDWTTANTQTGVTSNTVRVAFDATVSARYVRIYVTQSGAPSSATGIRIDELELFSSMFESGMTTRATVTGNTLNAKATAFEPVTAKAVRVYVTSTTGVVIVSDMKVHAQMFDGGTVNTLASRTNSLALTNDLVFDEVTARYFRVMITAYNSSALVTEVEIYNTTLPEFMPERTLDVSYDSDNARLYAAHNFSPPEDGQITRLDNVLTTNPTIGQILTNISSPALVSREVSSVEYVDSQKLIVGTSGSGISFVGKRYAEDLPTIIPNSAYNPSPFANWLTFTESATKNGGEIYYQLSNDGGTTWYFWDGDSWAEAGAADYNVASAVDTNIKTFSPGTSNFKWKAFLSSNGGQQVILNSVSLTYNPDGVDPATNASTMTAASGANTITSGNWSKFAMQTLAWSAATDDQPNGLGILGYCMYFGTSNTADPISDKGILSTSQSANTTCPFIATGTNLTLAVGSTLSTALVDGATYYVRVRAIDVGENLYTNEDISTYTLFTYKYDATNPNPPSIISVSPSGYTSTNTFNFIWPSSGEYVATDPGAPTTGSGIAGYQYKSAATTGDYSDWSETTTESSANLSDIAYQEGANLFYLRSIDNANNTSTTIQVTFYYAGAAPTAPQNLQVSPSTTANSPASTNAFSFSWSAPASYNGSIKQYQYLVNSLPSASSNNTTTATSLSSSSYATQQGKNTLYIVAVDEAGNVSYNLYASVDFYCETAAPGMPRNVGITDSSNRAASDFRLTVTWSAPSSGGTVSQYVVKRSTDNSNYTEVGTVSSTVYVDSGLSQDTTYFYKIYAEDNAAAISADPGSAGAVSKKPTGKFTNPPTLTSEPVSSTGATNVEIEWKTDRSSDSFVEYGTTTEYGSSFGQRDETLDHNVKISGLQPGTLYYYRVQSLDSGDLRDYSDDSGYSSQYEFTTGAAPSLSNVSFSDITTNSAILSFDTNKASSSIIEYGTTTDYGSTVSDDSGSSTSKHTIRLKDLSDGTTYQLKIKISDSDGNELSSIGHAFTTLAMPKIENLRLESLPEEVTTTVRVSWRTNVETSASLFYSSNSGDVQEVASSVFENDHEFVVRNLMDQSIYTFRATSRDQFGNEVQSGENTYTTPIDTRAPGISEITIESSNVGTGNQEKAQAVVSWITDEPSTSMVEYGEGLSGTEYTNRTNEDKAFVTDHLVIISNLTPGKPYHIRVVSSDKGGNVTNSDDHSIVSGNVSKSAMQLVLKTLNAVFGWMGGWIK